jgi:hypothetical protein
MTDGLLYTTNAVPSGFALHEIRTIAGSHLLYMSEFDGTWLPTDGAFALDAPFSAPFPGEPGEYVDAILEAAPGSSYVEVNGRPGVILETEFAQDGIAAPLIWVLGTDARGGVFEITAIGMTRDQVLDVASGVVATRLDDFLQLGSQIGWDVNVADVYDDFSFRAPADIADLAVDIDVALGIDVLLPRLAYADQDTTVVTADDGSPVEPDGSPITSSVASMFLDIEEGTEASVLAARADAILSPELYRSWLDRYVASIEVGRVLSDNPYVVQAIPALEPDFDVTDLGQELPIHRVESAAGIVEAIEDEQLFLRLAASEDRPVIALGSVTPPDSDLAPTSLLVWFTKSGDSCHATLGEESSGSGCGQLPMSPIGTVGESSFGGQRQLMFAVPEGTAVVQVTTPLGTYWQRPVAGYGLVAFADGEGEPTEFVAFDVAGRGMRSAAGEAQAERRSNRMTSALMASGLRPAASRRRMAGSRGERRVRAIRMCSGSRRRLPSPMASRSVAARVSLAPLVKGM